MSFSDDQTDNRDLGIFAAAGDFDVFMHQVDNACKKAVETIQKGVDNTGNRPLDKAQGNYAEYHHAASFNTDAVLKRARNVRAHVLESTKKGSPDIVVTKGEEQVREYGLKYYKTAKDSVNAQKGYSGQERLIPDEQVNDGREYIKRQIAKDRATGRSNRLENADELERIEESLTGRVQEKGVQSESLSREDAEKNSKRSAMEKVRIWIYPLLSRKALRSLCVRGPSLLALHLGWV